VAVRKNAPLAATSSEVLTPGSIDTPSAGPETKPVLPDLQFRILDRPAIVWVIGLFIASKILRVLPIWFSLREFQMDFPSSLVNFIHIGIIIPEIIFLTLLFNLKRSSLLWLYISLGLEIVFLLFVNQWIPIAVVALFGWLVWDYIKHKKENGKPLFN